MFKNFEKFKKNIAFIDSTELVYTYSDILKDTSEINNIIDKKALLLLIINNKYEALIFYIFAIMNNVPILLIDDSISELDLKDLIINYKPLYVAKPILKKRNIQNSHEVFKKKSYCLLRLKEYENSQKINAKLALLLTTSGTTGSKKFVRLSNANLQSNAVSISKYLNIDTKNITITTLSPSYSYGLSIINSHLFSGACIVLNDFSIIQKQFWSLCKKYKVNSFSGVPYSFELLKKINLLDFINKDLKYITVAGGALDNKSLKYFINLFKKINLKLYIMYGQTEASPRISYVPYEYLEKKIGSIGIPIPGGKMSILLDKKNNKELIYTGPNVCLGYAEHSDDLDKGDENNGVLYTGDLVKKDDEGFYYITGRTKRIMKYFGSRINLDEIEKKLNELSIKSACIGDDDTILKIFHHNINDLHLISDTLKKLKINKKFYITKIISELPRNSSGKIDYFSLKKNEY